MTEELHPPRASRHRTLAILVLIVIVTLGLLVRVHGITRESVWWDEFASLINLDPPEAWKASPYYERWRQAVAHEDTPDLRTFLQRNRKDDPATMPLYYTLEYAWNRCIGRSVVSLRVLSVLLGVLAIPLIYLLGRDLYGTPAGLAAALCLALSPVHRQYSQEIRNYVVVVLLALLSAYTFVHVVQNGRRRWWALHGASNFLLMWTHPFALLLPFVEGAFLLTCHLRNMRRLALWVALHLILAIPAAVYVSNIRFWSVESTQTWMQTPTTAEVLGDLLADDAAGPIYRKDQVGVTPQFRASPGAWESLASTELAQRIVAGSRPVAKLMMILTVASAIWLGVHTLRGRRKSIQPHADGRWWIFLVMWWLVPALVLCVASILWRPCWMPRYTLHSSLAVYVLIGGAIASIPWPTARVASMAVLAAVYGYEALLVLGGPQHADWKGASEYIAAEARPEDPILIADDKDAVAKRMLIYNLAPVPNVFSADTALDVLAEQCLFWIQLDKPVQSAPNEGPQVWAVVPTLYFADGPSLEFEAALRARGLSFMLREFGGIQHVLVYRVRRDPQVAPHRGVMPLAKVAPKEFADLAMEFWKTKDYDTTIALAKRAIELDPKFPRSYTYLGMALKEKAEPDAALEALQKGMAIDPKDYLWTHVNIGTLLTDKGRYDEAVAAFKKALEQDPKYGWAWTCMGKAYLGKGDVDAAIDAFEKAAQSDPNDPRGLECLKEAQDRKRGTPRPAPPVISPKAASPVPPKVPAAETKPPVPDVGALIEEGKACLAKSEYDGALAVLRKALERDSNNAQLYGLAALALLGKGDDNGALVSFHKFMALNPEEGKRYEPLIQAAFETKDYNAAWAEVKRLQAEGAAIPRELIQRLEHNSGRKE